MSQVDTNELREVVATQLQDDDHFELSHEVVVAADTIDRQAALIAKFEEAITKALSWLPTDSSRSLKKPTAEAVKVLESALKGASNQ